MSVLRADFTVHVYAVLYLLTVHICIILWCSTWCSYLYYIMVFDLVFIFVLYYGVQLAVHICIVLWYMNTKSNTII